MTLSRISLQGFKSIRKLDLDLNSLNVMIGANGAGKSNFITVFRLLNEMVNENFQSTVTQAGGAETFLYFGSKVTDEIKIELQFPPNGYICSLKPAADDSLYFEEETCLFQAHPSPWRKNLGSGHIETKLLKTANTRNRNVASYVLDAVKSWKVYHFHDTSDSARVKKLGDKNDNLYFRPDASNLAAFLYFLKGKYENHYMMIRETVRQVAPFFGDFILRPDQSNDNKIRLEWREQGRDYPFMAYHLSDGTLRFICLATLLLQPTLPSTILIDEPELGLHPYAISILAALLQSASKKTQVIVSTQSVPLVNQFQPEDIIVVERIDEQSVFRRLEESETEEWLEDYGLGDLWEKNLLGGRP